MAENERGFHHRAQQNFEHGHETQQGRMEPGGGKHKHMAEPTNHGGHTHEIARRHESDRRIESMRNMHAAHAGESMGGHEKVLHETHKLHQGGHFTSHGNKHGASHHWRDNEKGDTPAHERRESAAERRREGE